MTKTQWNLDPAHSAIRFKAKHLMITSVTGDFKSYAVTAETDGEDFSTAKIDFTADVASVATGNEQRDIHLKSADFFDAENHPTLAFASRKLERLGQNGDYRLTGDLTIRGVTKPVAFAVEFGGIVKDPWGNEKAGFTLEGRINRKDWGLNWNVALETGGWLVSEEVRLLCDVQLSRQTN